MAEPRVVSPEEEKLILDLRPELQNIARRYGIKMLHVAIRTAGLNVAFDELLKRTRTSKHLQAILQVLINNFADMHNELLEANGWKIDVLLECMADVGRARQMAAKPPSDKVH